MNNEREILEEEALRLLTAQTRQLMDRELNAVSEYCYLSLSFEKALPELSGIFDVLAEEETHHHRRLGGLLLDLGADPAWQTEVRVSGGIDLREDVPSRGPVAAARALRENVGREREDGAAYRRAAGTARRCGREDCARLFEELAGEEDAHRERQSSLLE